MKIKITKTTKIGIYIIWLTILIIAVLYILSLCKKLNSCPYESFDLYCKTCHNKFTSNKYCPDCGTSKKEAVAQLSAKCEKCNKKGNSKYCSSCGGAIIETSYERPDKTFKSYKKTRVKITYLTIILIIYIITIEHAKGMFEPQNSNRQID